MWPNGRITSGSLFGGLSVIGAGAAIYLPEARWIGLILIVVGVLMLFFNIEYDRGHFEFGTQQSLRKRLLSVVPTLLVLTVILVVLFGLFWYSQSSQVTNPQRPYDLTGVRRKDFLELLEITQSEPRDTLKIGCIQADYASCVSAGQFLILFSEAGWKIDSNRVYMMYPDIPVEGMTIATPSVNIAEQMKTPPHLGLWASTDPSHLIIKMAFTQMDIPVHFSSDQSAPSGTLGIYFGPEPASTPIGTLAHKSVRKQLTVFLSKATEVEQACSHGQNEQCKNARDIWERQILAYLGSNGLDPSFTSIWKNLSSTANMTSSPIAGIDKQKKLLIEFFFSLV